MFLSCLLRGENLLNCTTLCFKISLSTCVETMSQYLVVTWLHVLCTCTYMCTGMFVYTLGLCVNMDVTCTCMYVRTYLPCSFACPLHVCKMSHKLLAKVCVYLYARRNAPQLLPYRCTYVCAYGRYVCVYVCVCLTCSLVACMVEMCVYVCSYLAGKDTLKITCTCTWICHLQPLTIDSHMRCLETCSSSHYHLCMYES